MRMRLLLVCGAKGGGFGDEGFASKQNNGDDGHRVRAAWPGVDCAAWFISAQYEGLCVRHDRLRRR
jgi:hypothetical protein